VSSSVGGDTIGVDGVLTSVFFSRPTGRREGPRRRATTVGSKVSPAELPNKVPPPNQARHSTRCRTQHTHKVLKANMSFNLFSRA